MTLLAFPYITRNTRYITVLINTEFIYRCFRDYDTFNDHGLNLSCAVPISAGGNTEQGIRSPSITPGAQLVLNQSHVPVPLIQLCDCQG